MSMEIRKPDTNEMVVAEGCYFDMDCYKTKLNNNLLVVGATGSGKTRGIVTPNILQATGSYIISDPKGNLYKKYGEYLRQKDYDVKLLSFDEPEKSVCYNPFHYVHDEKDILKLAHMLIYDRQDNRSDSHADPFWDRSAEVLLSCLIAYLKFERPECEQTMDSVLKLLESEQLDENTTGHETPLDRIMESLNYEKPGCFAYRQFMKYRAGAKRTKASIIITLNAILGIYGVDSIRDMTSKDQMSIETIGDRKTAIFVVVSDTDSSMDEMANLFYTQAMNELCRVADSSPDNRLDLNVRFILDDFANTSKIDGFPRMIASIRSRGISTTLIIQAESQLERLYGYDARTIIGNCDTYVYLGGQDVETAENVSRRINKPLDDVLYMPVETNWVFRRGQRPVFNQNFDLDAHLEDWGYWIDDTLIPQEVDAGVYLAEKAQIEAELKFQQEEERDREMMRQLFSFKEDDYYYDGDQLDSVDLYEDETSGFVARADEDEDEDCSINWALYGDEDEDYSQSAKLEFEYEPERKMKISTDPDEFQKLLQELLKGDGSES